MEIGFLKTFTEKGSNPIVTKQQQQRKKIGLMSIIQRASQVAQW